MSVLLYVDFDAKPDQIDELRAFLTKAVEGVRAADGCESADLWADDGTRQPRLVEVWTEKSKSEAHLAKLGAEGILDKVGAMCTRGPIMSYHEKLS